MALFINDQNGFESFSNITEHFIEMGGSFYNKQWFSRLALTFQKYFYLDNLNSLNDVFITVIIILKDCTHFKFKSK